MCPRTGFPVGAVTRGAGELLSDELLHHLMAVGHVDVLVGVPTLNNAPTIRPVVKAVHQAFSRYFPARSHGAHQLRRWVQRRNAEPGAKRLGRRHRDPHRLALAADRSSHQHAVSRRPGQGKRAAADHDCGRAHAGARRCGPRRRSHRHHARRHRRAHPAGQGSAVPTTSRRCTGAILSTARS